VPPLLLIALGGALGSVARYLAAGAVHRVTPPFFPYGTFVVNVTGCLVFGVLAGLANERAMIGPNGRLFLLVGVLGGYTTFSTFGFETFELVRTARIGAALANAGGQVVAGVAGVWLGTVVSRVI
jgi:CrcB protein